MKKLLLGMTFLAIGVTATAQTPVHIDGPKGYIYAPFQSIKSSTTPSLKKQGEVSNWFNWNDAARDYGASYSRISNSFIFPDSTVKQIYGDGQGGTTLGYAGSASVGQIMDPKSSFFDPDTLRFNKYTRYVWDSLSIFFYYNHAIPGSVDTLIIQYYKSSASPSSPIVKSFFDVSKEPTAFVRYNPMTNLGLGSFKTDTILLTEANNSPTDVTGMTLAIGANIAAGQVVGFTMSYIPGFKYEFGDTIDWKWENPVPTKKLNGFIPYTLQDKSKTGDSSYNNGLKVPMYIRYNKTTAGGWKNSYIPGDAWNDYNEYIFSSFYLSSINLGINEFSNINGQVELYPNPAQNDVNVNYSLKNATEVSISVKDIAGKEIMKINNGKQPAGKQHTAINTSNLKAGVYFVTIQAGVSAKTVKLVVSQ